MKRGDLKYRSTEGYINHGLVEDERSHRSQSRLSRSQEPPRRLGASSRAPSQLSVSGRLSRQQKHLNNNIGPLSYRSHPSPPLSPAMITLTYGCRHDAPILNDKYFPKSVYGGSMANIADPEEQGDTGLFKYPHLQLRNVSYSVRRGRREERILDMINIEAIGGELVAILATSSKYYNYIL